MSYYVVMHAKNEKKEINLLKQNKAQFNLGLLHEELAMLLVLDGRGVKLKSTQH